MRRTTTATPGQPNLTGCFRHTASSSPRARAPLSVGHTPWRRSVRRPGLRAKRARLPRARHGDLDVPSASGAIESCKRQSSSGAVGGLTAGIGQTRSRRARPSGPPESCHSPDAGLRQRGRTPAPYRRRQRAPAGAAPSDVSADAHSRLAPSAVMLVSTPSRRLRCLRLSDVPRAPGAVFGALRPRYAACALRRNAGSASGPGEEVPHHHGLGRPYRDLTSRDRRRCIGVLNSRRSSTTSGRWPAARNRSVDREGPASEVVVLRALGPGDRHLVALILEGLGPESRLQRFLAPRPVFSERDLSIITRIDGIDHAGVIAFAGSPAAPVGAAHYVRAEHPELAETAIEVVDDWQRCGIGRLLIAELCVHAVGAGIRQFEWFAFESNRAVAALVGDLGDCRRTRVGNGVIRSSAPI